MTLNRQLLLRLVPVVVLPTILLGMASWSMMHSFIEEVAGTQQRIAAASTEAEISGQQLLSKFAAMQDRQNAFTLANASRLIDMQVTQLEDLTMILMKQQVFATYMRGSEQMRHNLEPVIRQFFEELLEAYPCTEIALFDTEGRQLLRVAERIVRPEENPFTGGYLWGRDRTLESDADWFRSRSTSSEVMTRTVDWTGAESGQAEEPSLILAGQLKYLGISYSRTRGTHYGCVRIAVPLVRLIRCIPREVLEEGAFALRSTTAVLDEAPFVWDGEMDELADRKEVGVQTLMVPAMELVLLVDRSELDASLAAVYAAEGKRASGIQGLQGHVRSMIERFRMTGWWMGAGVLLVALLTIASVIWVARGLIRPIMAIEQAAARIRAGHYNEKVPTDSSVLEIRRLAASIDATRSRLHEEITNRDAMVRQRTADLEQLNARLLIEVEERRRAEEAATAGSRAKSNFVATISHEIRTPLNGVIGSIQALRQAGSVAPEGNELLEMAESSGRLLLEVVNDVLDFSRIEADRVQLECAPFDFEALVHDVRTMFMQQASAKGLLLECRAFPSASVWFLGDGARVKQLIVNLLGNAVKFTESGGVRLRARYWPSHAEMSGRLCVAIGDTGPGIPPDQHAFIFEPFHQLDDSRARQHGGTGLGLAICMRFLRLMGGTITVRSKLGMGSVFRLSIPLPLVEPSDKVNAMVAHASAARFKAKRILIAEDNPVNQRIVQILLEKRGHHVCLASDGQAALDALTREDFDLLLLDIHMPVLDGLATARAIRARPASARNVGIQIIALTANAAEADRSGAIAAGMNGFLTKPVRLDALLAAVENLPRDKASPNSSPC